MNNPNQLTDGEWVLMEIDRLELDAPAKNRILEVLESVAGRDVRFNGKALSMRRAIAFILHELRDGKRVSEVKNRLVDFGYAHSERTAYRQIQSALDQRGRELEAQMIQCVGQLPPIV